MNIKKALKIFMYVVITLVVIFASFIIFSTINNFQPDEKIVLVDSTQTETLDDTISYTLLTWNIGYCGLSSDMDFFYDGGKKVRPEKNKIIENLKGIEKFLNENNTTDFILLQEVDTDSKRSYNINEFDSISAQFPEYQHSFGINYKVFFVPIPFYSPMGKVNSGIVTLSKYAPKSVIRYAFPGNFDWPKNLFMLDRCFVVNRYNLANEKELVIINTHNSAFDDGSIRDQEMKYFKYFLEQEYEKGNYVVVGGDWNQCPPGFYSKFKHNKLDNLDRKDIDKNYIKNWIWRFDNNSPTNRRVKAAYDPKKTLTTVIDFYLHSPNIESVEATNVNLNFQYSDHQPVKLTIKFKKQI